MRTVYEHNETPLHNYQGAALDEQECRDHLKGAVKDNLLDREQREELLDSLKILKSDTGFDTNDQLLADIQALEKEEVNVRNFRIGEAYAEIVLEENFQCRFHWNELRDARNPKGNKTGADLVGFIEIDGQVLFLFVSLPPPTPHLPQNRKIILPETKAGCRKKTIAAATGLSHVHFTTRLTNTKIEDRRYRFKTHDDIYPCGERGKRQIYEIITKYFSNST